MGIGADLRHAIRSLSRSPGFALVTILTLALGIGANTAIFSVVSATILRPLPYPKPDQLIYISSQFPSQGFDQFWVSAPEFVEFRERTRVFSSVGAYNIGELNLTAPDHPRRVNAGRVSADLFTTLGVAPLAGRTIEPSETLPNAAQVVVLSNGIWRSAFGADPAVVGRSVEIGGIPRTVIGIMPPGFDLMDRHVDLYVPLVIDPANRGNRGGHFLYLIGRLADSATAETARAELETLLAGWPASIATSPGATPSAIHTPNTTTHRLRFDPLLNQIVGSAGTAVLVLQGAVVLVLLIACANVASLLLARAESRHKEFAVRAALGAGRWTLVRPFMAEALLLALAGGALGVGAGVFGVRSLIVSFPNGLPRSSEVTLDAGILIFSLVVALGCAFIVGLAPLLHLSPAVTASALKEAGPRSTAGAGRNRLRRALVTAEVALAVSLVIGAGLLLRTVVNLSRVDNGFDRGGLVTFGISLPPNRYPNGLPMLSFHDRLMTNLKAIPGVSSVSGMTGLPPQRDVNANDTDIEGYTVPPGGPYKNVAYYQTVTTNYVETMGIPVVQGRSFQNTDATGAPVVLINETMAQTFYRGENPLGRRVQPSGGGTIPWYTIVGVLKDVKQGGVDQKTGTELYFNYEQLANSRPAATPALLNVVVRTSSPLETVAGPIQRVVGDLDASLPIIRMREMEDVFSDAIGRPRLLADLLGVFAALALALAAIGIYGVLSYMVSERRREIGIRMALGAARSTILGMVLSQGIWLTGIGLVVGLAMAAGASRVLTTLLFGVAPTDIATIVSVAAIIMTVSMIGCYLPARRATRVDPMVVLRDD